jgi:hypothetical protein
MRRPKCRLLGAVIRAIRRAPDGMEFPDSASRGASREASDQPPQSAHLAPVLQIVTIDMNMLGVHVV